MDPKSKPLFSTSRMIIFGWELEVPRFVDSLMMWLLEGQEFQSFLKLTGAGRAFSSPGNTAGRTVTGGMECSKVSCYIAQDGRTNLCAQASPETNKPATQYPLFALTGGTQCFVMLCVYDLDQIDDVHQCASIFT